MQAILTNQDKAIFYNKAPAAVNAIAGNIHHKNLLFFSQLLSQHFTTLKDVKFITAEAESYTLESRSCEQAAILIKFDSLRYINKFLTGINHSLVQDGTLIGYAETSEHKKKKILARAPAPLNHVNYTAFFLAHRVFPKISKSTASIYFSLFKTKHRVLSKAEIMGRLCSCGFSIIKCYQEDDLLYFVAKKTKQPEYTSASSYWPIFRMKRVGRHGKNIFVYKLRTMHPYSEYLQNYIRETHGLEEGGKFKNDFRISSWGKILRKYWIDEVPMLLNLLKGEMKLIGVRPLSEQYYNMYPDDLKAMRIKFKPGLIPPFYADMPKTLEEIIASEKKYLQQYEKRKIKTDFQYFFLILKNIFLNFFISK